MIRRRSQRRGRTSWVWGCIWIWCWSFVVCAKHWRQCRQLRIAGGTAYAYVGEPTASSSSHEGRCRRDVSPPPTQQMPRSPPSVVQERRRKRGLSIAPHRYTPRLDCHRTAESDVGVAGRRSAWAGILFRHHRCSRFTSTSPSTGGGFEAKPRGRVVRRRGRTRRVRGVNVAGGVCGAEVFLQRARAHRPCGPARILGGRRGRRVRMYAYVEESSGSQRGTCKSRSLVSRLQ